MKPFNSTPRYKSGDLVPFHLTWYIVVISYFVSLIGSFTTVELLHRRKAGRGWISWLQLGACSISFGLVAIWCMHFVGNRAIVLGNNEPELQLYYNPGWTALSVFLPIVCLFGAFMIAETKRNRRRVLFVYLLASGLITGLSVTGMHYVGNFGIVNYKLLNPVSYVIGAAAVAILACIIALTLFFLQKELWINSWWRRLICAVVLAGAVSGMHFLASVGTTYRLSQAYRGSPFEKDSHLIVAIVLAVLACCACVIIALWTQRRQRKLAEKASQVVLASATFDPEGRILVTSEGILPSEKVTRQYHRRSFEDDFNIAHPVFHWLFRVTHNWMAVVDLIPGMRSQLRSLNGLSGTASQSTSSLTSSAELGADEDYSLLFRELFCVAAADLAQKMDEPVENLGVLSHEIMVTGTAMADPKSKRGVVSPHDSSLQDLETGFANRIASGKGQVLFLVREVNKIDTNRLASAGFRFASINNVKGILARSMQVSVEEIVTVMNGLQRRRQRTSTPRGGTVMACFAIRPAIRNTRDTSPKWDVLVQKEAPSELPSVSLSPLPLKPWQTGCLLRMNSMSVDQTLQYLVKAIDSADGEERAFLQRVQGSVVALIDQVLGDFFRSALLCTAKIVKRHCHNVEGGPDVITIIPFCVIPDVHNVSIKSANLTYLPLGFFGARHQVYKGAPHHAILTQKTHQEFGPILSQKKWNHLEPVKDKSSLARAISAIARVEWPFSRSSGPRNGCTSRADRSSEGEFVEVSSYTSEMTPASRPFGGIMVSSDITIDPGTTKEGTVELLDLGIRVDVGAVSQQEQPTFVDDLFRETCALSRKPQSSVRVVQ